MNKILAYSLWILLSLSSVSAIWCVDCETKSAKEKCPKGKEASCWAGEGESCYRQNLYGGTRILFVRFGCIKGCKYVHKPAKFLWHSVICCNQHYCNKETGGKL